MTKYKEYVDRMLATNEELFANFKKIHDEYALNPSQWQAKFNSEGEKVLLIVHDWENKLCLQSEKGGYGKFTTTLSEKFQQEVKRHFPMIDHIGLKVFSIKKINL